MTRLVDSHCHLTLMEDVVVAEVLDTARQEGVEKFLCVSIDLEGMNEIIALSQQHPDVYASAGVHPTEQPGVMVLADDLRTYAQQPEVIAVGETGLDYYRLELSNEAGIREKTVQQERFRMHIRMAIEVGKPLIIHCREASEDVLKILREEQAEQIGGVMHCFVEDWQAAEQFMALNFMISLSGIVTFKNAKVVHDVAKRVPLQNLLIETDSPWLAPVPFRGKKNQPAYVGYVAQFIADLRGIETDEVMTSTTENFCRLFAL
jgi:TatD DNase family protein